MMSDSAAAAILKRFSGKRRLVVRLLEAVLRPLVWFSKPQDVASLDEVRQVLVFEPGSLGDMVMLMPFLRSLRARFPKAKLSLLCRTSGPNGYASIDRSSIETLLLSQKYVDELIPVVVPWLVDVSPWKKYNPFSPNWPRFAWTLLRLRSRNFDLAFPTGRSDIRYNLVLWLAGAKRRVGYAYAGGGFFLTDVVAPDMTRVHQTEISLQLLEHLDIPVIRGGKLFELSAEDKSFSAKFLKQHGLEADDLIVGVHAGSRVASRTWGRENFQQVAERLTGEFGAKVIWFGDLVDSGSDAFCRNIVPVSFPLREFLAILARCSFLVCNDSGPMHMAGALGVPVVAIFGSTFPEWYRPPGVEHRVVIRRDIPCRPCGDRCIFEQPYCLRLIPIEQVIEAVSEAVEGLRQVSSTTEAR